MYPSRNIYTTGKSTAEELRKLAEVLDRLGRNRLSRYRKAREMRLQHKDWQEWQKALLKDLQT